MKCRLIKILVLGIFIGCVYGDIWGFLADKFGYGDTEDQGGGGGGGIAGWRRSGRERRETGKCHYSWVQNKKGGGNPPDNNKRGFKIRRMV